MWLRAVREIRTPWEWAERRTQLLSCSVFPHAAGRDYRSFPFLARPASKAARRKFRRFCVCETISSVGHRIWQIVLRHERDHMWTGIREEGFQVSAKRRRPFQNCSHSPPTEIRTFWLEASAGMDA